MVINQVVVQRSFDTNDMIYISIWMVVNQVMGKGAFDFKTVTWNNSINYYLDYLITHSDQLDFFW